MKNSNLNQHTFFNRYFPQWAVQQTRNNLFILESWEVQCLHFFRYPSSIGGSKKPWNWLPSATQRAPYPSLTHISKVGKGARWMFIQIACFIRRCSMLFASSFFSDSGPTPHHPSSKHTISWCRTMLPKYQADKCCRKYTLQLQQWCHNTTKLPPEAINHINLLATTSLYYCAPTTS